MWPQAMFPTASPMSYPRGINGALMAKLIRSKKYQTLSDQQILKRLSDSPAGEALHFLEVEIDARDLQEQLNKQAQEQQKKPRHSIFYYCFYLFLAALFLGRFGSSLL